ncbi:MAG: LamB/YcsF family protein, partial [Candidatus Dormibacteraeota bacterium]|nr:LamB/YcsF family protein [Candidatus Dormibacteraeota bacterium]
FAQGGDFDSICIHGDSPGAGEVARSIREALRSAGVETGPNLR